MIYIVRPVNCDHKYRDLLVIASDPNEARLTAKVLYGVDYKLMEILGKITDGVYTMPVGI